MFPPPPGFSFATSHTEEIFCVTLLLWNWKVSSELLREMVKRGNFFPDISSLQLSSLELQSCQCSSAQCWFVKSVSFKRSHMVHYLTVHTVLCIVVLCKWMFSMTSGRFQCISWILFFWSLVASKISISVLLFNMFQLSCTLSYALLETPSHAIEPLCTSLP